MKKFIASLLVLVAFFGAVVQAQTVSQIDYGTVENTSTANLQTHNVKFTTPFAVPPYVFVTSRVTYGIGAITVSDITTDGFTLTYYSLGGGKENMGFLDWKAEGK